MDKYPELHGSQRKTSNETEIHPLQPAEVRMILSARTDQLRVFSTSPRLRAVDLKGDTPLHIAARMGHLGLCSLFMHAGADTGALNHQQLTPSEVALGEGHLLAAELLEPLAGASQVTSPLVASSSIVGNNAKIGTEQPEIVPSVSEAPSIDRRQDHVELDDLLVFEPEEDPEDFFDRSLGEPVSGSFVSLATTDRVVPPESNADWEVDLSPVKIEGDGINPNILIAKKVGDDRDFLKVRTRGRRSIKQAEVPSGTRLSIDFDICLIWAEEVLEKGWFTSEDIDTLLSFCEGNGDLDELRINTLQNLEAAGLRSLTETDDGTDILWDNGSDISVEYLAESLEATLSRATRLPGTQRFYADKANEARLFGPIVRAKQELTLGVLACEQAVDQIFEWLDLLFEGSTQPSLVTMKTVTPSRTGHEETAEFIAAVERLRMWKENGRVMDGKRRRQAYEALDTLELSLEFYKTVIQSQSVQEGSIGKAHRLSDIVAALETAVERLLIEHLPYARRFASRNVEKGEDPEDVFQIAFTGLQRSTGRFDPKRGVRFGAYSMFWMRQAVMRWRADEGALIRIPVHRQSRVAEFDKAVQQLEARYGRLPTQVELVAELGWTTGDVDDIERIPRRCSELVDASEWYNMTYMSDPEEAIVLAEVTRIVAEALSELPERQADVIRKRFGIGCAEEMTLEEIGQIYGVTRERIRQIEAKGLARLARLGSKRRLQTLLLEC